MKANNKNEVHLGDNIKNLMRTFHITQTELADKLGMPDSQLCVLLRKSDIDDSMLQKIADAMGYGVSVDMIQHYDHDDTIRYIINNYTQNVENGGTGNFKNDNSTNSTFEEGSQQTINHYVAEHAFELAEKNTKLEKLLLYYRMKVNPEAVEKEIASLEKEVKPDQI